MASSSSPTPPSSSWRNSYDQDPINPRNSHSGQACPLYRQIAAPQVMNMGTHPFASEAYKMIAANSEKHIAAITAAFEEDARTLQTKVDACVNDADKIPLLEEIANRGEAAYRSILKHLQDTADRLAEIEREVERDRDPNGLSRLDNFKDLSRADKPKTHLARVRLVALEAQRTVQKLGKKDFLIHCPSIIMSRHLSEFQDNGGFHFGDPRKQDCEVLETLTSAQSGAIQYTLQRKSDLKTKTSTVFQNTIPEISTLVHIVENSHLVVQKGNRTLALATYKDEKFLIESYHEGLAANTVFPIFFYHEFDSSKVSKPVQILQNGPFIQSSDLGNEAVALITRFSNEIAHLDQERNDHEIDKQKRIKTLNDEIDKLKADIKAEGLKAKSFKKGSQEQAQSALNCQSYKAEIRTLNEEVRKVEAEGGNFNEREVALGRDNPLHFSDENYIYVDLAVAWTEQNGTTFRGDTAEQTGIHRGLLVRISRTDPILNNPALQQNLDRLSQLPM